MPRYDYKCCKTWEQYAEYPNRDSVRCGDCGKLADRLVSMFSFVGATHVGTDRFKGAEQALGVSGIESSKEIDKICEERGIQPVDAYYRQKPIPPPAEIPDEDFLPYLS